MHYNIGLMVISGIFMLIGLLVSSRLKSKFAKYSQERLVSKFSGKEVAEKMLRDNGIFDVKIQSVDGQLTDHYNPKDKTVNLSHDVYHGQHVAAAAVAAHELLLALPLAPPKLHAYAPTCNALIDPP